MFERKFDHFIGEMRAMAVEDEKDRQSAEVALDDEWNKNVFEPFPTDKIVCPTIFRRSNSIEYFSESEDKEI